ncbi:MAG: hypothetical protein ACRDRO_21580 [Pseudonocardiaceae bacterium]
MSIALVYVYGVPKRLNGADVTLVGEVDEQLWLAHQLREDLVTIEHERHEALAAVWSSVPRIAQVEATIAELEPEVAELVKAAARERSQARARGQTPSSPRLAELRKQVRALKADRKAMIGEVHDAHADRLEAIETERYARIKEARKLYTQAGVRRGNQMLTLYWATGNDVIAHHQTAAKRINATRAQGRPAQLRHHRFDGAGSLAAQLQRQAGVQPRSPVTIADGETGKWRNVLHLPGWVDPEVWTKMSRADRRHQQLAMARMNIGDSRHVHLPVIVHRMMPPDADITGARLVTKRIAGTRKHELHLTVALPDPEPVDRDPVVALHLGWRHDPDLGTVRVATWRSTHPVQVPVGLDSRITPGAPVVVDSARTGQIVLHDRWFDRLAHHDHIRAQRDTALDELRTELVAWLQAHGPTMMTLPPSPSRQADDTGQREVTAGDAARWKAPGRFAVLAMSWRTTPPPGGETIAARLETWRAADRRAWETEAHGRERALANRTDLYRQVAAWIAGHAGKIVVDDTAVSAVARRPDPTQEPTVPGAMEQAAARRRTHAAPGRLREIMVNTATREGVTVEKVPHTGITRTHYRCGHLNPPDDRYATSLSVLCDGCGAYYHQDDSATLMQLAAAGAVPPAGPVA